MWGDLGSDAEDVRHKSHGIGGPVDSAHLDSMAYAKEVGFGIGVTRTERQKELDAAPSWTETVKA